MISGNGPDGVLSEAATVYFSGVPFASTAPLVLFVDTTQVGTINNTDETDLLKYTLPAGALTSAGHGIRVTVGGKGSDDGNNKTVKFYWNGVAVATTGAIAIHDLAWRGVFEIFRSASNEQIITGNLITGGLDTQTVNAAGAATEANAIALKVTGQNAVGTVDGVVNNFLLVEYIS